MAKLLKQVSVLNSSLRAMPLDQLCILAILLISWGMFFINIYLFSPLWLFFNITCTVLFFLGSKSNHQDSNHKHSKLISASIFIIFIIAWSASRYSVVDLHVYWLDEESHLYNATRAVDLIYSSAHEQQPFLSYLLARVIAALFGHHELWLRLVGFIPTTLALIIFLNRIRQSNALVALFLIPYFVFNWDWLFHSLEIRAIGCGLLGTAIWYKSYERYFEQNGASRTFFSLILSAFIYLNMVGLQPPFILLSITLSLLPWLIVENRRSFVLKAICAHAIAVALMLPNQYEILKLAAQLSKFKNELSIFQTNYLANINWHEIKHNYMPFYLYSEEIGRNLTLLLTYVFIFFYYAKNKDALRVSVLTLLFLFPVLFYFFFMITIDWWMSRRYVECWRLLFTLVPFVFLADLKFKKIAASIAFLMGSLSLIQPVSLAMSQQHHVGMRQDWKVISQYINKEVKEDTPVFVIGACKADQWCPFSYIGWKLYIRPEIQANIVSKYGIVCPENIRDCSGIVNYFKDNPNTTKGKVIIVYDYKFNAHRFDHDFYNSYKISYADEHSKITNIGDFLVFEAYGNDRLLAISNTLRTACTKLPNDPYKTRVCEYAVRTLLMAKRREEAAQVFRELEARLLIDTKESKRLKSLLQDLKKEFEKV